ncbi:MAG: hypothetical protein K6U74_08745, partial [Firmicutes bacterium]|nr:hypothetical protein [Bacillota bacterium]
VGNSILEPHHIIPPRLQALKMKQALKIKDTRRIDSQSNEIDLRHVGLSASNSSLSGVSPNLDFVVPDPRQKYQERNKDQE